jgi:hypothetical protein
MNPNFPMQAIPKKKYRKKVRQRLSEVHSWLLEDENRLRELMKRIGGFDKGSDLHNKFSHLRQFLESDVPALLDALDTLANDPIEEA